MEYSQRRREGEEGEGEGEEGEGEEGWVEAQCRGAQGPGEARPEDLQSEPTDGPSALTSCVVPATFSHLPTSDSSSLKRGI